MHPTLLLYDSKLVATFCLMLKYLLCTLMCVDLLEASSKRQDFITVEDLLLVCSFFIVTLISFAMTHWQLLYWQV